MKLLFFTDTHLRATTPENRKDDILDTLKEKLSEVVSIANENGVSAVIHGGDLFDIPNPGLSAMGELIRILTGMKAPIYIINGNHDIYGHNISTLNRTLLGFLISMGAFTQLSDVPIYIDDGNVRVQLTGSGYVYSIDDDISSYVVKKVDCDVAIHVVHGMLLDKVIFPGAKYTLIDDIKDKTEVDITLAGHNHLGFPDVKYNGKYFLNPGSLIRLSNHPMDMKRMPGVILIDLEDGIKYKFIRLKCAKTGEEVLDRSKIEEARYHSEKLASFLQGIRSSINTTNIDPYSILDEVINEKKKGEGMSDEVIDEVKRRFAEAEAFIKGGM